MHILLVFFSAQPHAVYDAPPQRIHGAPPQAIYGTPPQGFYGTPPQGFYGAPTQGVHGTLPQGIYGTKPLEIHSTNIIETATTQENPHNHVPNPTVCTKRLKLSPNQFLKRPTFLAITKSQPQSLPLCLLCLDSICYMGQPGIPNRLHGLLHFCENVSHKKFRWIRDFLEQIKSMLSDLFQSKMDTVSVCDQCHLLMSRAGDAKRNAMNAKDIQQSFAIDMQTIATILNKVENSPTSEIFAHSMKNGYGALSALSEDGASHSVTLERINKVRRKLVDLMQFTVAQMSSHSMDTHARKIEAQGEPPQESRGQFTPAKIVATPIGLNIAQSQAAHDQFETKPPIQPISCQMSTKTQYECDLCQKRYGVKQDIKLHLRMVHGHPIYVEPPVCPVCLKVFSTKQSFQYHQMRFPYKH